MRPGWPQTIGLRDKLRKNFFKENVWLRLAGFLLFFFLAYTWAAPFRDLYGMEIRNALAAREMLENGLTIIPKVFGEYYPDYLPLYFWLETVFSLPAGAVSTLSAIMPSALSAVGLLALTFCLGRRITPRAGWLSALILATIPSFWCYAGGATIDMLLAFCVTGGILCFYFGDEEDNPKIKRIYFLGGCVALAGAFMVKGPIGIVLPAISWGGYLLLNKRLSDFIKFSLWIMLVGVFCIGLEFLFAYLAGGRQLVSEMIKMQVTGRLRQANKPFYYYFFCILGICNLWLFLILASRLVSGRLKEKKLSFFKPLAADSVTRLAVTWVLGILTVFSLAATKHSRYLLPLYPAAAILLGGWVEHFLVENNPFRANRLQTSAIFLSAVILSASMVFYFLFNQYIFISLGHIIIWLALGVAGIILILKWIHPKHKLAGSVLLLMAIGISGANLLATPALSRRASAREFVTAAESQASLLPVMIHGLGRDGDALKYLFYSNRNPEEIRFVDRLEELNTLPAPCLLITDMDNLPLLEDRNIHKIVEGNARSTKLYAYRVNLKEGFKS